MHSDTIAAIATPLGEGGIGIVRLSGSRAIEIADQAFLAKNNKKLQELPTFRIIYGKIVDRNSKAIDEAIAAVMLGPGSYTGEDVVELQCHGGIVVIQKILDLVLSLGARLAQPGEFTKRAFLNGRLDLSQAEAVIDVIRSKTELSLDLAMQQLEGSLSNRIHEMREKLYDIIVRVEASIDFPEDDIPDVEYSEMADILQDINNDISQLIATADSGKVLREGLKTVITGKPNVGKSSLLNRLLNENRALVTDIPGTTRDVIEEMLNLEGIPIRLLDTAGIRESDDVVEQMGVERAMQLVAEADLVLHVLDVSTDLTEEDQDLLQKTANKQRIIIVNKIDLPSKWKIEELPESATIVQTSLVRDSLESVISTIVGLVKGGYVEQQQEGAIITRSRHKQLLMLALEELKQAQETLAQNLPVDLIAIGLQGALEYLGEITGETVRDNIVERIFAQFCIGK